MNLRCDVGSHLRLKKIWCLLQDLRGGTLFKKAHWNHTKNLGHIHHRQLCASSKLPSHHILNLSLKHKGCRLLSKASRWSQLYYLPNSKWGGSLGANFSHSISKRNYSSPDMSKVRPTGQMRPLIKFWPARLAWFIKWIEYGPRSNDHDEHLWGSPHRCSSHHMWPSWQKLWTPLLESIKP